MTIVPQPPPTVDLSDVIEAIEAMGRANNEAMQGFGLHLKKKERERCNKRERRSLAAGKYPVKPKVVDVVGEGEGVDPPEYVVT